MEFFKGEVHWKLQTCEASALRIASHGMREIRASELEVLCGHRVGFAKNGFTLILYKRISIIQLMVVRSSSLFVMHSLNKFIFLTYL